MAWYATGTVQVTSGSKNLTFTGAALVTGNAAVAGMGIQIEGDSRTYELETVDSDSTATISVVWPGSSGSGKTFKIVPIQGFQVTLAKQVAAALLLMTAWTALPAAAAQGDYVQFIGTDKVPTNRTAVQVATDLSNKLTEATVASATNCNIGAAACPQVEISGTTTITSLNPSSGTMYPNAIRYVRFSGALTLTHGSTLILPGSANITTAAGDWAIFKSDGSSTPVWRCISYQRIGSVPYTTASPTFTGTLTTGSAIVVNGSDGSSEYLRFTGQTARRNWQIGNQININDAFEITPSTANGGSTFSSPAISIVGSTLATTIYGSLTVNAAATFNGNGTADGNMIRAVSTASTVNGYQIVAEGKVGGYGAGIALVSKLTTSNADKTMGLIVADGSSSWSSTDTNSQRSGISLWTCNNGTLTKWATLTYDGNLGLGTASPPRKLTVSKAGAEGFEFGPGEGSNLNYILNYNRSTSVYVTQRVYAANYEWLIDASAKMYLSASGYLSVGTGTSGGWLGNAAIAALTATGTAVSGHATGSGGIGLLSRVDSTGGFLALYSYTSSVTLGTVNTPDGVILRQDATTTYRVRSGASGGVELSSGATSWTAVSLRAEKDRFAPIADPLAAIMGLRAELGLYKSDADNHRLRPFLYVEDALAVFPYAVANDNRSMSYTDIVPLLVAGTHVIVSRMETAEEEIARLKDRVSELESRAA